VVCDDRYPDWDAIYRDNVVRLYRLMYVKVGNHPDAEDLTTEVFMAALGPCASAPPVAKCEPISPRPPVPS